MHSYIHYTRSYGYCMYGCGNRLPIPHISLLNNCVNYANKRIRVGSLQLGQKRVQFVGCITNYIRTQLRVTSFHLAIAIQLRISRLASHINQIVYKYCRAIAYIAMVDCTQLASYLVVVYRAMAHAKDSPLLRGHGQQSSTIKSGIVYYKPVKICLQVSCNT